MDSDERTYGKTDFRDQIREQRRTASLWVTLRQQELDALAKIDEGAGELEQVQRAMAALARGESVAESPTAVISLDPQMTGGRALKILESHHGARLAVRNVVDDWMKLGYSEDTEEERKRVTAILRHSLARLAAKNDHVKRDERGPTFYYWYVADTDDSAPVAKANGTAQPALQGRLDEE